MFIPSKNEVEPLIILKILKKKKNLFSAFFNRCEVSKKLVTSHFYIQKLAQNN